MPKAPGTFRDSTSAPRFSASRALALSLLVLAPLASSAACRQSQSEVGLPEARLSASAEAQTSFRNLRTAWFSGSTSERRKLEPDLRRFLQRFPSEEPSDMVRVLLAFDCASRGSLQEARVLIAQVRSPVGAVHDFSRVAEAYALLRESKAEEAWTVLEPLAGKIVDSDERLLFSELRVRAAASARRYTQAVQAAQELLSEAPSDGRAALEELVREQFQSAGKTDLVEALASLEPKKGEESTPAREWLRKLLRERLVTIAVREKDAELARSLLDTAPAALRAGDTGSALIGIASGVQSRPLISGHRIGVALSLGNADVRRRSASLAAGLSRALRGSGAPPAPDAVQLITQDDGGNTTGTLEALRELAAEGAAILVAGLDGASADIAVHFSEENAIPVLLVQPPETWAGPLSSAFVLGESSSREQAAIDAELSRRGLTRIARVGRAGDPCDAVAETAGGPRFAVQQWRRNRVSAVLVLGSAACASDVARDLLRVPAFAPELALGLEAAEFVYESDAPRTRFALGAGSFPSHARSGSGDNPALPALDWYEALGHDAALLAQGALEGFPEGRVDEERAVHELHARAQRALASVQAPLWTSEERGFSKGQTLNRTLTIVSPPSAKKSP
ncbi:MAG TPA: hypothetical protein VER12_20810 [Polyangiaceae bacterium]|nr:hypothetical protein [Polyangiaceae bacterium]